MALPRDVHPVVLAYRADLWRAAGVDLARVRAWPEFIAAAKAFEAHHHQPAVELPRGNASVLLLLLQQRGVELERGLGQQGVAEALAEYAGWVRAGIGTEPGRRVEQTAEALAAGRLGAVFAPDWKLGQIRRLLPPATQLTIGPLPGDGPGGGPAEPTPTWGGTGAGVPRYSGNPERGWELLRRVMTDSEGLAARYAEDGIVPPVRVALEGPEAAMMQSLAERAGRVPIAGEPTAAVQRELNAVLRSAVAAGRGESELTAEAILRELRAADERLARSFPGWGRP